VHALVYTLFGISLQSKKQTEVYTKLWEAHITLLLYLYIVVFRSDRPTKCLQLHGS